MSVISAPAANARGNSFNKPAAVSPFDLLLACCRSGEEHRSRRKQLLFQTAVDWSGLIELAEQHDVLPLLHRNLGDVAGSVPAQVLEHLALVYRRNAQKNLRFTYELLRVLECLDSQSIAAMPYKGPLLAQEVYGEVALRQFSDLDILIDAADLAGATAAVARLGHLPSPEMTEAEERAYLASGYERSFDGPAGPNILELQWRILPRFYSVEFSLPDLFERSSRTVLAGKAISTLSPEDLLHVLGAHAAKHAWARLSYLCDIAATISTQTINYESALQRARELGIARIVGVSFWLVRQMLEAPLPHCWSEYIRNDRRVEVLGSYIQETLSQGHPPHPESSDYFRLMLRLRERAADKWRFLSRLVFTPSVGEWSAVRLPAPLFPAYRAIRLVRLVGRLFPRQHGE
ncbi:MAG: hypothetical protein DMG71_20530 [Acidobacteria bacterium]|nr:MAG: hypothetical protein DMG71_20530 [Acidobacteriota bacterium]